MVFDLQNEETTQVDLGDYPRIDFVTVVVHKHDATIIVREDGPALVTYEHCTLEIDDLDRWDVKLVSGEVAFRPDELATLHVSRGDGSWVIERE
jgi:hypothetical protein